MATIGTKRTVIQTALGTELGQYPMTTAEAEISIGTPIASWYQ